jgi:Uma2 family endonuclease
MSVSVRNDARVWLSGVAWDDYVRLRDIPESRNIRMTYDEGSLELMSPSKLHERIAELVGHLVFIWTLDREIPVQSCGTTTFQREDRQKGLEPDKCYYIQHEADVRDRDELDLAIDPPPDLVVEVDVTSPSRRRFPIYSQLGVPEVWLWRNETLQFFLLDDAGQYAATNDSTALPDFPRQLAERFLTQRREKDETTLLREFRQAIRR